jgi:hypothetical protein
MAEPMHNPMPVAGYKPQSEANVALANELKYAEERLLRQIDDMMRNASSAVNPHGFDGRMIALGRTKTQEAFMWLVRSIFQPTRVRLPEDEPQAGE